MKERSKTFPQENDISGKKWLDRGVFERATSTFSFTPEKKQDMEYHMEKISTNRIFFNLFFKAKQTNKKQKHRSLEVVILTLWNICNSNRSGETR